MQLAQYLLNNEYNEACAFLVAQINSADSLERCLQIFTANINTSGKEEVVACRVSAHPVGPFLSERSRHDSDHDRPSAASLRRSRLARLQRDRELHSRPSEFHLQSL